LWRWLLPRLSLALFSVRTASHGTRLFRFMAGSRYHICLQSPFSHFDISAAVAHETSNHAMQPTAIRFMTTFPIIKNFHCKFTLAAGSRG
jgi:hypothetical protein